MKKYGLLAAIALILVINAIVFTNVGLNRAGEPDAIITLTERELPLSSFHHAADRENSGVSLRLAWQEYPLIYEFEGYEQKYAWFDKTKLEAIGFDCSLPLNDPNAERHYGKMLPRNAYVVLEYEGKAWEAWKVRMERKLEERALEAKGDEKKEKEYVRIKKQYEQSLRSRSRLFAVDAGRDPHQLRLQYPDRSRYIIAAARVRPLFKMGRADLKKKVETRLEGTILDVLSADINVPLSKRDAVDALLKDRTRLYSRYQSDRESGPHYAVTLIYGKRYEPWVAEIKAMGQ